MKKKDFLEQFLSSVPKISGPRLIRKSKKGEKKPKSVREDKEIEEILHKIEEQHQELEIKLEKILNAEGTSYEELKRFFDNPNNLSSADFNRIQEMRKENEEKLKLLIPDSTRKSIDKKAKEKEKAKRRRKDLGQRRGWIDMR